MGWGWGACPAWRVEAGRAPRPTPTVPALGSPPAGFQPVSLGQPASPLPQGSRCSPEALAHRGPLVRKMVGGVWRAGNAYADEAVPEVAGGTRAEVGAGDGQPSAFFSPFSPFSARQLK